LNLAQEGPNKILDYATPPPPLMRRDSAEYYREEPELAKWGWVELIGTVVGSIIVFGVLVWWRSSSS
jgi:hypothetical protein